MGTSSRVQAEVSHLKGACTCLLLSSGCGSRRDSQSELRRLSASQRPLRSLEKRLRGNGEKERKRQRREARSPLPGKHPTQMPREPKRTAKRLCAVGQKAERKCDSQKPTPARPPPPPPPKKKKKKTKSTATAAALSSCQAPSEQWISRFASTGLKAPSLSSRFQALSVFNKAKPKLTKRKLGRPLSPRSRDRRIRTSRAEKGGQGPKETTNESTSHRLPASLVACRGAAITEPRPFRSLSPVPSSRSARSSKQACGRLHRDTPKAAGCPFLLFLHSAAAQGPLHGSPGSLCQA